MFFEQVQQSKFSFPRESRLLTPQQFSFVFSDAIPAVSPIITILARKNEVGTPRLGITVAKKRVKLAVQRNRIKRCIRESFRLNAHLLPNIDIIVIAKQGIGTHNNDDIYQQLTKLWKKIHKRCQ